MRSPLSLTLLFLFSIAMYGQDPVYELVWSDEFFANVPVNTNNWHHQTLLPNGDSWYNGEIQHYTNRIENSFASNGFLKISAIKETFTDQGVTKQYTSARLNSKFAFTYGKVEIRAKLPFGVGTWPAIWTLGQNIIEPGGYWTEQFGTTSWPACGEIDIMEHWGDNQNFIQSATHTPSSFGNTINKGGQSIPTASNEFHIYTMEWTEDKITFSVDDVVHYTYEPEVKTPETWPFDEKQYILLNVAILPNIDPSYTESAMEIDYVRVYQEEVLNTADNLLESIRLFPNPANDILNIKVPQSYVGMEVALYTALGQKVHTKNITDKNIAFEVSELRQGTYFLHFTGNNKAATKKFVKI